MVVNRQGVIVGLARMLNRPLDPLGLRSGARVSWSGFASPGAGPLSVLAITRNGEACRLVPDEPAGDGAQPPGYP